MSLIDLLFGRPLRSSEERGERLGPAAGIPIFGLDALSSAAYGPEAALTLLIPLGVAGISYIVPISASVIILLLIVYFSYRQTIEAYPTGGGSYTVAHQNLGAFRVSGERVPHRRNPTGTAGIRERTFSANRSRGGKGCVLLHYDQFHSAGSSAFGQHCLC